MRTSLAARLNKCLLTLLQVQQVVDALEDPRLHLEGQVPRSTWLVPAMMHVKINVFKNRSFT